MFRVQLVNNNVSFAPSIYTEKSTVGSAIRHFSRHANFGHLADEKVIGEFLTHVSATKTFNEYQYFYKKLPTETKYNHLKVIRTRSDTLHPPKSNTYTPVTKTLVATFGAAGAGKTSLSKNLHRFLTENRSQTEGRECYIGLTSCLEQLLRIAVCDHKNWDNLYTEFVERNVCYDKSNPLQSFCDFLGANLLKNDVAMQANILKTAGFPEKIWRNVVSPIRNAIFDISGKVRTEIKLNAGFDVNSTMPLYVEEPFIYEALSSLNTLPRIISIVSDIGFGREMDYLKSYLNCNQVNFVGINIVNRENDRKQQFTGRVDKISPANVREGLIIDVSYSSKDFYSTNVKSNNSKFIMRNIYEYIRDYSEGKLPRKYRVSLTFN